MALNSVIGNALSGLQASQLGLRTRPQCRHVNTPGYARTELAITSRNVAGQGMGVQVRGVERITDEYLLAASVRAQSDYSAAMARNGALDRLQAQFGGTDDETSIFGRLNAAFSSLSAAAADSAETVSRLSAASELQSFFDETQRLSVEMRTLRNEADTRIGAGVGRINEILQEMQDLNIQAQSLNASASDTSGAANRQVELLDELSSLIDVRTQRQPDGRVFVSTADGVALLDNSRLNLEYTVMSKRLLTQLVEEGICEGWDDPRMPTIAGLRRRGFTPGSIREFCQRIGVTKADNLVEMGLLENTIREDLDQHAPRAMAVLHPLKVVLTNLPENAPAMLQAQNHPKDSAMGSRQIPFGSTLYIDRTDFERVPPKGFKRLVPGGEVRLRNAYVIRCDEVIEDEHGEIVELRCSVDADTLGKNPEGRKVKGVIHWVDAAQAVRAEIRLYDRLFNVPQPGAGGRDFRNDLNPNSLRTLTNCVIEPSLASAKPGDRYQFEREGYFIVDPDSTPERQLFNRTLTLRDTWGKAQGIRK